LPTCALTGKIAADRVIRETKMKHWNFDNKAIQAIL
jgi:hypothetical protein